MATAIDGDNHGLIQYVGDTRPDPHQYTTTFTITLFSLGLIEFYVAQ